MQQTTSAPACRALLDDTHFTDMLAELAALSPLTDESDSAVERLNPLRDFMRRLSQASPLDEAIEILPRLAEGLLNQWQTFERQPAR